MVSLLAYALIQTPTVEGDIVYKTIGKTELKLDAYKPAKPNGRVFIALHGGGFTNGEKGKETGKICSFLMRRGFTCFDVNYRIQEDPKSQTIQKALTEAVSDALSAVDWVQKNASKYGGDPYRISIGGTAGGAVTAMSAVYSKRTMVKSVVDLWGAMFGAENDIVKGDPALLIVHGKTDQYVPFHWAQALANRVKSNRVPYRFLTLPGGHNPNLETEIDHYTILEHIDSFLRETS